ncbi:MAG: hypothetical protein NTW49_01280 [Bacteroidia bacterium]|nr:hypothetical protein [Bacteroidia bacterium]
MKFIYYLFILLLLLILVSFCKQDSNDKIKNQISKIQSKDTTALSEGNAYKMLYENQLKSNDSILKTIFYALGGLGSAVLLMYASTWWFNEKKVRDVINEIDTKIKGVKKDTLTELTENINKLSTEKSTEIYQIQNKLQEETAANITELTLKFTELSEKIRAEIKEDNKGLINNYQKQLETFNQNYVQQINSLNDNIKTLNSDINEKINSKEENLKGLINSETQLRLSEINSIKANIFRNEFWMWDARGVHINALRAQLNELALKLENKYSDLHFYLEQILETSKKLSYLYDFDKKEIRKLLTKVPENNMEIVFEILKITDNLKEL